MLKSSGLKVAKLSYLFLILNLVCIQAVISQDLELKIEGISERQTTYIDSLGYLKKFEDLNSLRAEISTFQKTLELKGFIENELISVTNTKDNLYLAKLDLKTKYDTIYIYYTQNQVDPEVLNGVSNNVNQEFFTLPIGELSSALQRINNSLISEGLPFSTVKLDQIKKKDHKSIEAQLKITTSQRREIDNIVVKGYENVPRAYLKYYAKIRKGQVLDLSGLKTKAQLLDGLPFVRQLRDPEILFTKDSSAIFLYLEKVKTNSFDGFIGFGTNEATDKLEFYGNLDLRLQNNLNFGENLNLHYRSDGNDQRTLNVKVELPYLFNTPIGSELSLNLFKQDTTFTTAQQTANLIYQINDKQKISLGVIANQSNNLLDSTPINDINDYDSNFFTLGYTYQKRQINDYLFPISFYLDSQIGFGNRKMGTSTQEQSLFALNTYNIFELNPKNSFYVQLVAQGINSDDYLTNELLRLGGINSIRGFEENSLFASLFGLVRTEYRYRLNSSIYVHSILDAAYLENQVTAAEEKLFGFGFGFGLLTRSGLLRFNYANGKSENQKFRLSNSKVHLSLSLFLF